MLHELDVTRHRYKQLRKPKSYYDIILVDKEILSAEVGDKFLLYEKNFKKEKYTGRTLLVIISKVNPNEDDTLREYRIKALEERIEKKNGTRIKNYPPSI